jgi:hypothetical protein
MAIKLKNPIRPDIQVSIPSLGQLTDLFNPKTDIQVDVGLTVLTPQRIQLNLASDRAGTWGGFLKTNVLYLGE